jgi:hypothetical protein
MEGKIKNCPLGRKKYKGKIKKEQLFICDLKFLNCDLSVKSQIQNLKSRVRAPPHSFLGVRGKKEKGRKEL